jgi:hypothetical protein
MGMDGARVGRLALRKGEGEGEGCSLDNECACQENRTPHLPPPLCYGAAGSTLRLSKGRGGSQVTQVQRLMSARELWI